MKYSSRLIVLAVFMFFGSETAVRADPIGDTVEVENGLLAGARGEESGVLVFKGVPYAAPPVGALRWKPPEAAADWEGIRQADAFAPSCIQNLARSRRPWTQEFMVQGNAAEDCLYLNVWTAADDSEERRPVLVYIHGGGFSEGSGSVEVYDGESLSRKGPVVVTINYRLGPLGFLAHPALTKESPHNASGNYGLMDQVAALEWVRDNIDVFGGDPDRVTVAGQSAGALSVVLLTASPLANGLFHRAIIQSGPGALASFGIVSTRGIAGPLSEAEAAGAEFAERKGVETLEALRALTPDELMTAREGDRPARFRAVIDGWFLTDDVADVYEAGAMHDVPTMSGMNADEGSAFAGYGDVTVEEFREQARERYGDRAAEFLALYPAESDQQAGGSQIASARDQGIVAMRRLAADRAKTAETELYLYYFDRAIPWPAHPEFGAFHTAEVPYVFDNLDKLDRPWNATDRELADLLSSYWANFAASGDPNGPDLPDWKPYDESATAFMVFGEDTNMRFLPRPDREEFFETVMSEPSQD